MNRLVGTLVLFVVTTTVALAQHWQPLNGPPGGIFWNIVLTSSGHLLALTENGVYRSRDGADWTRGAGLPWRASFSSVAEIAPGVLVVGGNVGGPFRSTDDGITWAVADAGVPSGAITGIVAFPAPGEALLIAAGAVVRSTDAGASWAATGLAADATSLAIDPAGVAYATVRRGVLRAEPGDRGTWSWTDSIVTRGQARLSYAADALWAFDGYNNAWRSLDGGRTWDSLATPTTVRAVIGDGDAAILLPRYGAWRTTDTGATWTMIADTTNVSSINAMVRLSTGGWLAATERALFRIPEDVRLPWEIHAHDIHASSDIGIAVGAGLPFAMLTFDRLGIASTRATASGPWQSVDVLSQLGKAQIRGTADFTVDSSVGRRRVAVSGIWVPGLASRIAVSDDGLTWGTVPLSGSWLNTRAIASSSRALLTGHDSGIVARSTDGGATWTRTLAAENAAFVNGLAVRGDTIWVATYRGVYISTDAGVSYDTLALSIIGLSIGLGRPGEIYVGSLAGEMFHSSDGGLTWSAAMAIAGATPGVTTIGVNSRGVVFVGTPQGQVAVSLDRGTSWIPRSGGVTSPSINTIVFDADDYAYLGTNRDGVFRSVESTAGVEAMDLPAWLDLR